MENEIKKDSSDSHIEIRIAVLRENNASRC